MLREPFLCDRRPSQVKFKDNESLERRVQELVEKYTALREEHEASTAARLNELATANAELDHGKMSLQINHASLYRPYGRTSDSSLGAPRPPPATPVAMHQGVPMHLVLACFLLSPTPSPYPRAQTTRVRTSTSALEELGLANDENRTLSQKIQALLDRVSQAEAGSNDVRSERDAYLDQRDRARAELERAERRIDALQSERTNLLEVQDELNSTIEELREKVESMRGLAGLEAEREQALEKARMLQEALEKMGAEKEELKEALAQAKAAGGSSFEELQACRAKVAALEGEMATCQSSLEKALKKLDVEMDEKKGLVARVEQLIEEASRQGHELSDARRELGEAMSALGVANDEKATLLEKTRSLAEQIKSLMAQVNLRLDEASGGNESQLAELRQRCDALVAENAELKGERERADALEAELKRSSSAQEELQGKMEREMRALSEANQELQDELDAARRGGAAGGKEVERLRERAAKLEAEIEQCRETLKKGFDTMKIRPVNPGAKAADGRRGARGHAGQDGAMALSAMVDSMLDKYRSVEVKRATFAP